MGGALSTPPHQKVFRKRNGLILLSLPVELVGEIISYWLSLFDIVRIVSAFCNEKDRKEFLELISSRYVSTSFVGKLVDPRAHRSELFVKKVKTSILWGLQYNINFHEITILRDYFPKDLPFMFPKLRVENIKTVHFYGPNYIATQLVPYIQFINSCKNLTHLHLAGHHCMKHYLNSIAPTILSNLECFESFKGLKQNDLIILFAHCKQLRRLKIDNNRYEVDENVGDALLALLSKNPNARELCFYEAVSCAIMEAVFTLHTDFKVLSIRTCVHDKDNWYSLNLVKCLFAQLHVTLVHVKFISEYQVNAGDHTRGYFYRNFSPYGMTGCLTICLHHEWPQKNLLQLCEVLPETCIKLEVQNRELLSFECLKTILSTNKQLTTFVLEYDKLNNGTILNKFACLNLMRLATVNLKIDLVKIYFPQPHVHQLGRRLTIR